MSALLAILFNLVGRPLVKSSISDPAKERAVLDVCDDLIAVVDDAITMAHDGWDDSDRLLLESSLNRLLENVPRDMEFPRKAVAETLSWAIDKIATSTKPRARKLRRHQESP